MTALVFRADASVEIGTGHVMRCLSLASAWRSVGGEASFVMAQECGTVAERLRAEGMTVIQIDPACEPNFDALQTARIAKDAGAKWVVIDGYQFRADYQECIQSEGLHTLFVDDYGHSERYNSDFVLNQNLHARPETYAHRESLCGLLLGTRYVLLRPAFLPWVGHKKETQTRARRILVTLGGTDPDNATLKVIEAMRGLPRVEARVVVGASCPHLESLTRATAGSPIQIVQNADMPHLMAWADVAVLAGGTTSWEAAFMGLPSVFVTLAENQRPIAESLHEAGAALDLGRNADLSSTQILDGLVPLMESHDARARMSRQGHGIVDGQGAMRVARLLTDPYLRLRPAHADDVRLVFEWANDPLVRTASFSQDPIPWQGHEKWFEARLQDPDCLFYLGLDQEGTPVGQVRFAVDGPEAVVSISLAAGARGKGYGTRLLALGCEEAFRRVETIHAYIKPETLSSRRIFEKVGFVEVGEHNQGSEISIHTTLSRKAPRP